jgi:glycosyltransferase involved in cell wall biosynthesis
MHPGLKVVHVVVAGQIGGAERFLVELASRPELSGAEHCLALMTPNPKLRAFFAEAGLKLHDRGPVRDNPLATLWRSLGPADIAWLEGVLREEKADVVHAHTYATNVLAARAARRTGLPLVRTEHGVRHYRDPSCALLRRWAAESAARLCAVSDFVARFVRARIPSVAERVEAIPNGIDLARWQGAPPPAGEPFTFLVLSRLDSIKRVGRIIEAAARVPACRLMIAGDGPEREKLERLADRRGLSGRIRFLGRLADPHPALAACHALVNGTREEGLGLAVLEAAAMARPAVAFAGGGIPEIVEDRRSGWLVQEDTVEALAAAMAEAIADPVRAASYGVHARALVAARFDIADMCRRYATVYRNVSGARRGTKE